MNAATETRIATMKSLRFGIEIETTGQTREHLARKVAAAIPGSQYLPYGHEGSIAVKTPDGREWRFVRDASLSGGDRSAEVVSPILTYADVELLQNVVRALRVDGSAKIDQTCGIHIHVDGARFAADPSGLVKLARLVYSQEDILIAALKVQQRRLDRYTRKVDADVIDRLGKADAKNIESVRSAWYGADTYGAGARYHASRYHGLNLNSYFYRGTIEFRYFEGTLHAGKVKAYVQLCLALVATSIHSVKCIARKRAYNPASAKYDIRVLLLRLGMIGEEFKTARHHLIDGLSGDAAFKGGRPSTRARAAAQSGAMTIETAVTSSELDSFMRTLITTPAGSTLFDDGEE